MSPYELVDAFVQQRRLFIFTCLSVGVIALLFLFFQPSRYRGEVVLSITRTALSESAEYAYDEYYRFQADEKLAETITQYLMSMKGKQLVADRAALSRESYTQYTGHRLRIARLGTQLILAEYTMPSRAEADRVGEAISFVASSYVASLNEDARDSTWFTILTQDPVISENRWSIFQVMGAGVFGGIFLAFWAVLVRIFIEGYHRYRTTVANSS